METREPCDERARVPDGHDGSCPAWVPPVGAPPPPGALPCRPPLGPASRARRRERNRPSAGAATMSGSRRSDWLLGQLPMGMLDDDFFVRFVSIFQEVATTMLDDVDNLGNVVDVTVAPEPMVRWLGSWLGLSSIDPSLPHELQRRIVRESAQM